MQNLLTLELAKRAVRVRICPRCYQRAVGSDALGPDQPLSCEAKCPLFLNLARLAEIAIYRDPMLTSYEQAVKREICESCTLAPSSGEFCSEYLARTCPLSRYAQDVIELIQHLPSRRTAS
jgi:hypothetical protein